MVVMKFGGSSLADASRIRHITEIINSQLDRKPVIVLSAMGDTTDHLLEAGDKALKEGKVETDHIKQLYMETIINLNLSIQKLIDTMFDELTRLLYGIALIRELTPRTKDYLVSFGERLSVRIVAAYLKSLEYNAAAFDSWDVGFHSNSNYTHAELVKESWDYIPQHILPMIEEGIIPVVTGFLAKDDHDRITTLGRGGSDLSATMIAASCDAEEVQVWKDVDGIMTADPRIVENTLPVNSVTYEEASELAFFGAQVLHPRAIYPCLKKGTPVLVKNSYNIDAPGTRIEPIAPDVYAKRPPVHVITYRDNVTLVDIVSSGMLGRHGFLEQVFAIFSRHNISVDVVATSEVSVSITLESSYDLKEVEEELDKIAYVKIKTGRAIVTIIGNVIRSSEILAGTFKICQLIGVTVQMISQGASKVNISFIVNDTEAVEVVRALHLEFFDSSSTNQGTLFGK